MANYSDPLSSNDLISMQWVDWSQQLDANTVPDSVKTVIKQMVIDISGLCIAAKRTDYVQSLLNSCDSHGSCTVMGHQRTLDRYEAALVNGTAAHGEDFDDTFEGTPVHVGAVIIPAVFAAFESVPAQRFTGEDLLLAIAVGSELSCRMALVAPMAIHRAGFHPTAVIGAMGAALAVSRLLKLDKQSSCHALGLAGSMSSGIIEYLAEGTWSKRMHAGWAAQSGLRAAMMARSGFVGPRTVFEGTHGFYNAFTNKDIEPNYNHLNSGLGGYWELEKLAFKPYPCGTMLQPFIDCALRLHRQGITADQIKSISCPVGEGTVHRLWEPLSEKRKPSSAYSAKFSVPFAIAVAIVDGKAGLEQFETGRVNDRVVAALAERISYTVDLKNEYPKNYSGHLSVVLHRGETLEVNQPYLRGGSKERLSASELNDKFFANATRGSWSIDKVKNTYVMLDDLLQQNSLNNLKFLRD